MVVRALRAGKHVVCEKPLTSSLALADAIAAEEKRSRSRVMPIFQCRFGDGIARVRHVIQSGLAGRHYLASIDTAKKRGPDYYAVEWRGKFATELGGVLATQAIHIHDLVFWLLGPATAVSAFKTTRVNPIEVEDCAVASLLMADGSLVSLSATLGSARQAVRMRFCFENVTFEKLGLDDDFKPGDEPWTMIPRTPVSSTPRISALVGPATRATVTIPAASAVRTRTSSSRRLVGNVSNCALCAEERSSRRVFVLGSKTLSYPATHP